MSKIGSISPIQTRRRIQFSLREVLLVAAVTFFGMSLIVPVNFRDTRPLGCLAVCVATVAAALLAFSFSELRSRWRKFLLIGSVALAWCGLWYSAEIIAFVSSYSVDPAILALALTPVTTVVLVSVVVAKLAQRKPWRRRRGWSLIVALAVATGGLATAFLVPDACTRLLLSPRTAWTPKPMIFDATKGVFTAEFSAAEIGGGREVPFSGYLFKVLKAQGEHAPGGRKSYVDESGAMSEGFALVARPSTYFLNGRTTFLVSHDGKLYSADLGADTAWIVDHMTEFDPDPEVWTCVEAIEVHLNEVLFSGGVPTQ